MRQALASLAGKVEQPPFIVGRTLNLQALGPEAKWAVVVQDEPESSEDGGKESAAFVDPRTGSHVGDNRLVTHDSLAAHGGITSVAFSADRL